MHDTPLYTSTLWPPVRPRAADPGSTTMELLDSLGLVSATAASGVFTLLPLGLRVHDRLSSIARRAFEERGAHTVSFPTLQSSRLWKETGRWDAYQREGALLTSRSRSGEDMCLAPTSEEIATATVRDRLRSFRDLPARLFLSTTKFRDELSPRGGLMRSREFTMADCYTFDASPEAMRTSTRFLNDACAAALTGMGLTGTFQAPADGGSISAGPSTEHLLLGDSGQSTILACRHCGNRGDAAVLSSKPAPHTGEPVVNVIVFAATGPDGSRRPTAVAIRSDLQVSARKLAEATGATHVTLLDPDLLPELYGTPAGTLTPWTAARAPGTVLLFDTSVSTLEKFAISDGADGLRTSMSWDGGRGLLAITPSGTDLHQATPGSTCVRCHQGQYSDTHAVEVAHVFELGRQYSAPMNLAFTDEHGAAQTPWMACSGIGITRCLQTTAEIHRDHHGLRWKAGTGPADLHLTVLRADLPAMRERTDQLVRQLRTHGVSLLIDDRHLPAGDKLRYARLLGLPHHALISPRHNDDEVEITNRWTGRTTTTEPSTVHQICSTRQ
ncbi:MULTISPECIES: aminoacyl--tRNA ligase-related protein [unclassified Streptomyces]|uniref:proline--tRNA ligase n=1 Tax=unclassified Streptomyces TaxID=2593676 RepID=UPI001EF76515|nr:MULTISPECIES: aminoacyl--tRNA ligase-related protein [unclassified Streptomyces]